MKFPIVVALIAVALAATTIATAAPTDPAVPNTWKEKQYFNDSQLLLTTTASTGRHPDCDWKLPRAGVYVTNVDNLDFPGWQCLTEFVWAKTCESGAQTFSMEKKVFLPGRALDLDVSLVSYGNRTLPMTIKVNGSPVLITDRSVHKRDLRGGEKAFRPGLNTITVSATKPKTRAGGCNLNETEYAFYAQIRAKFANDIVVERIPRAPGGAFLLNLTVTNNGPTANSFGSFTFAAYTGHLKTAQIDGKTVAILISGPGLQFDDCFYGYGSLVHGAQSYTGHQTSCPLPALEPGESATYRIIYGYKDPGGTFYEEWPAMFVATGEFFDQKGGNNTSIRMQAACRPAGPNCKPPKD